jgi:hypothetical protein
MGIMWGFEENGLGRCVLGEKEIGAREKMWLENEDGFKTGLIKLGERQI